MDLPVEVVLGTKFACGYKISLLPEAAARIMDYSVKVYQLDKIPYYSEESNKQRLSQK